MFLVGDVVGQSYRIVRLIGQGGMGDVWEALHEPLSRRVAIKTIRLELASDPDLLVRFRREAESSAALGHPNIVQVSDFIMEPNRPPIMVMELLEGRTLRELLTSALKLDAPRAVFIALQVLSGLASAHKAGIIHRDVKPANVFLQKTLAIRDHVKLLDFGVAKLSEQHAKTSKKSPLTTRGMVLGTRAYMAPEQELGDVVDARADLYSVAATLYFALSGRKHREANADARSPIPLSRVEGAVPAELAHVIDRALSYRPEDRYASAEEMAEALTAFSKMTPGLGKLTILPRGGLEAARPLMDSSSTETAPPTTERDERFGRDVLDSAGAIQSVAPATAPLNPPKNAADRDAPETKRDEEEPVLQTQRMRPLVPSTPPPAGPPRPLVAVPVTLASTPSVTAAAVAHAAQMRALATTASTRDQTPSLTRDNTVKAASSSRTRTLFILLIVAFVVLLGATLALARYLGCFDGTLSANQSGARAGNRNVSVRP